MRESTQRVFFIARLALTFQRALAPGLPAHRIDQIMRRRAWHWFSEAQAAGLVLQ